MDIEAILADDVTRLTDQIALMEAEHATRCTETCDCLTAEEKADVEGHIATLQAASAAEAARKRVNGAITKLHIRCTE